MIQVLKGYMTTKQAAKYLGYDPDYICSLCINEKLPGAGKFGNAWAIPEQSVYEYKPGLQGQAAINARKEAECRKLQDDLAAQGIPISTALVAAILG